MTFYDIHPIVSTGRKGVPAVVEASSPRKAVEIYAKGNVTAPPANVFFVEIFSDDTYVCTAKVERFVVVDLLYPGKQTEEQNETHESNPSVA